MHTIYGRKSKEVHSSSASMYTSFFTSSYYYWLGKYDTKCLNRLCWHSRKESYWYSSGRRQPCCYGFRAWGWGCWKWCTSSNCKLRIDILQYLHASKDSEEFWNKGTTVTCSRLRQPLRYSSRLNRGWRSTSCKNGSDTNCPNDSSYHVSSTDYWRWNGVTNF